MVQPDPFLHGHLLNADPQRCPPVLPVHHPSTCPLDLRSVVVCSDWESGDIVQGSTQRFSVQTAQQDYQRAPGSQGCTSGFRFNRTWEPRSWHFKIDPPPAVGQWHWFYLWAPGRGSEVNFAPTGTLLGQWLCDGAQESGLHNCKADSLLLEPHLQSILL
jgi:hypothetical protein